MAVLAEGEWELDGFVFGGGGIGRRKVFVLSSPLDYGDTPIRSQDAEPPGRDGITFGRDYLGGPELSMTLGVIDEGDVWSTLAEAAAAWRPVKRTQPGWMSTLRVMRNGVSWRMYGRPRKFSVKPTDVNDDDMQIVDVTFQLAEPYWYRETPGQGLNEVSLQLVAPTSDGGAIWGQMVWPVEFRSGSQSRFGGVVVASTVASPFTLTVKGPVSGTLSNISVSGTGWKIATSATLAWDQTLIVDTRLGTIARNGANVPGTLSRDSRLNARLQPGAQQIRFTGTDPTATARATISWLDAAPI